MIEVRISGSTGEIASLLLETGLSFEPLKIKLKQETDNKCIRRLNFVLSRIPDDGLFHPVFKIYKSCKAKMYGSSRVTFSSDLNKLFLFKKILVKKEGKCSFIKVIDSVKIGEVGCYE